ncbi:carbohydrate ABC transporter permease [Micropruina sp.]|uniref:carbohydrate ABC transporter permease n=1 Tax=Micropruina sp. TaxID=2737536 RepID=UPI0039E479A4
MSAATAAGRRSGAPRQGRRPGALERRTSRFGWFFAAPAVALFGFFFAYPLVASLMQSFQVTQDGVAGFGGLANYEKLAGDDLVWLSLMNAGILLIFQVPLMIGLALLLAVVLNQSWLKFRTTFRMIHFLPAVTTLVAYSLVFRVMLQADGGVINQLIGVVGIPPIDWLNNPFWARVALIGSITWRWTGYNMVLLLAGLQGIPREQYESAALDGATGWRTFRHVVVPQLRPVLIFTSITSTIGALQLFDENFILTGGGPSNATLTPVLYLYRVGFRQFDFGYASAIAWLLVLVIGIFSIAQYWLMRDKEA